MDYQAAVKLCFLLGFLCCWLITLTIRTAAGAVRMLLLRMEVKELARQVEQLEQGEEHRSSDSI